MNEKDEKLGCLIYGFGWVVLIIAIFIVSSCSKITSSWQVKKGESLPTFSVIMNDGEHVSNESLSDKDALIVLFNTKCNDCVAELKKLQPIYEEIKNEIKMVLVSREESALSIEKFWDENGFTMPFSAQLDRKVYNLFTNKGIPFTVFTKNGKIYKTWTEKENFKKEDLYE